MVLHSGFDSAHLFCFVLGTLHKYKNIAIVDRNIIKHFFINVDGRS
jgi:hypothetical protein